MDAETKNHLSAKSTWFRALYMLLFFIIFNVAEVVTWAVVILQFLFKLFTGRPNQRLQNFGRSLSAYFQQVVAFLTFHTEEMPYPFSEWPSSAGADVGGTPPVIFAPPSAEPESAEAEQDASQTKTGSGSKPKSARKPAAKSKPKPKDDPAEE